jgi:hypothetical protein
MEKDQVTPPLPDRIAAAIDAYAQKSVACGSRYETGPIAARTTACALIAEVVAERDWLQHHFPEQIAKALGTTSEVTGRTPSMVASCVAKVVAERDAALSNTSLPGYCRLVKERDAATKRADGLDEKWARAIAEALMTTFHPRADNSVEVWAAHVRREHDAHTRKDDLFRKACNDRDAARTDLAAAQAKLAEVAKCVAAWRSTPRRGEEFINDNQGDCISYGDSQATHFCADQLGKVLGIAAAEQGGA